MNPGVARDGEDEQELLVCGAGVQFVGLTSAEGLKRNGLFGLVQSYVPKRAGTK